MQISHEMLQLIVDSLPVHLYWTGPDTRIIGANIAQAINFGDNDVASCIGKNSYDFAKQLGWSKEFTDALHQEHLDVIKTAKSSIKEYTGVLADGEEHIFLSQKYPLIVKGTVVGIVGISIDTTERKKLEQELKQAKQLQEKSQNAKIQGMMEIAAGIAHEIRTPLTSIQCATDAKVYIDRLIAGYKMAEEAGFPVQSIRPSHMEGLKNIFNSIDAEAKESMHIIDMFLDNLKGMVKEANAGDYQLCSIKEAVSGALARYPFDDTQNNAVVYVDANDFKFYGVNLLVQHIIFNLMKNALHYVSEKPGAAINIRHEQGDTENYLYFKDNGPGMSEYDQTRIFDFGFSKRKDGSGFGLTYCKTTMQQMGGDIAVCSELDKYTEFVLTFPKVIEW